MDVLLNCDSPEQLQHIVRNWKQTWVLFAFICWSRPKSGLPPWLYPNSLPKVRIRSHVMYSKYRAINFRSVSQPTRWTCCCANQCLIIFTSLSRNKKQNRLPIFLFFQFIFSFWKLDMKNVHVTGNVVNQAILMIPTKFSSVFLP